MVWMGVLVLLGPACGPQQPVSVAVTANLSPFLGTWIVSLSEEERRRLTVYELALQEHAPGESELSRLGLLDDDLETLRQLRALPRDAPQVVGISEVIDKMSGALVITEQEMRMEIGPRKDVVAWSLITQQGDTLRVAFEGQGEGVIRLDDDGSLVLIDSQGQELSFIRQEG
ncbi:MAG: hypothetical protein P8R54_01690 [Myxococcota bacterium]|nr:hypothetical protein [Myxococcota bacterium]